MTDHYIPVTSKGHGKGGGTSTIFSLDDLVTAKLDAVDQRIVLIIGNADRGGNLAEEGNNGLPRVATDDGNSQFRGVRLAGDLSNESLGTDNIESGDAEETLGVEDALGL